MIVLNALNETLQPNVKVGIKYNIKHVNNKTCL